MTYSSRDLFLVGSIRTGGGGGGVGLGGEGLRCGIDSATRLFTSPLAESAVSVSSSVSSICMNF